MSTSDPRSDSASPPAVVSLAARLRDWLLLDVNRSVLAGAFLGVVLAVFSWLEATAPVVPGALPTALLYLFSALATGNITLITLVITINQLVLSRELRSPRELETEVHAAEEYRNTVEDQTQQNVVPERPRDFLRWLAEDTRYRVHELRESTEEIRSEAVAQEVGTLCGDLLAELDSIVASLERSQSGIFPALSTVLDADFSARLANARWIDDAFGEDVPSPTRETLQDLADRLEHLDIARQYLKTIYVQKELSSLSKQVVYTGFVAELVALTTLAYLGYLRAHPAVDGHAFPVPLAVTASLAPFALVLSHVLRIATVAQRTVAITPFLTPE